MSKLALKLIAENKAKHECGEYATYLDLGNCGLTELPEELFELVWLEKLVLSANQVSDLSLLSGLASLRSLDVSRMQVSDLSSLSGLASLRSLDVSNTQASDLSPLSGLASLQSLSVFSAQVSDLSPLSGLASLQSLSLFSTLASDLSPLSGLASLRSLVVSYTQASDLSPLSGLASLRSLVVSYTQASDLSPLSGLASLRSLDVSGTQVSDLSPLSRLVSLRSLDVSGTQVSDLSPLSGLVSLRSLDVSGTQASDLSPLSGLASLQSLDVSGTQASDLSPLSGLASLQSLNVSGTQASDLSPLSGLALLQSLDVSRTQASDLSPLSGLALLQSLDVSRTQASDLSPLSGLAFLQMLDVSRTQASDLSPLKTLIEKGIAVDWEENKYDGIRVLGCPLTNPPLEIVKQGNEAILNYWKQTAEQGIGNFNEAKLIIVGEGKTGKTSLFNKLITPGHDILANPTDETHGINIHEGFEITHGFRVNLWDFGGQSLQYMTHQFFLTPRALYVLLMEARAESPNLSYWFNIINLLGKGEAGEKVSLLLVLNKRKGSTGTPQYQDILQHYESDFDYQFLEVDFAEDDKRWDSLKETIVKRLQDLPIIKNPLPLKWIPIREALREEAKRRPYIGTERLSEICTPFGIVEEKDQWQMTSYLHQLGSLLHFQNDNNLMDLIVLQPEWAVEGVYATLKSKLIREVQKGKFSADDMFGILTGLNYKRADVQKILHLMAKNNFDICYTSENGNYVAVQLLPDNRPEQFKWHKDVGTLQFRYQYPIMPKGLMSRLIVRMSDYLENVNGVEMVWKKGAVLNIKKDGSLCRVLMYEDDGESKSGLRQIVIEVMEAGPPSRTRKYALQKVREEVKKLHTQWFRNIKFEEIVPCNCEVCRRLEEPFTFRRSELLKLKKGRAYCNLLEDFVPITQLLDVFESELSGDVRVEVQVSLLRYRIFTNKPKIAEFIAHSSLKNRIVYEEDIKKCNFLILDKETITPEIIDIADKFIINKTKKVLVIKSHDFNQEVPFDAEIEIEYSKSDLEDMVRSINSWILLYY